MFSRLICSQSLAVVLLLVAASSSYADECDAILEQGVRNTYQDLKQRDLRTGFRNAMCQSASSGGGSSSGGGLEITVPIFDVPVKFGGNYNQARTETSSSGACSDASSNFNDKTYSFVLQQVVAPEIVSAWSQCRANQGGFFINGELNGNILVLEFRFRPAGDVVSTKVIAPPIINGASCPNPVVKNGTVIRNSKLLQRCYREGAGEVTVVVNTRYDGARFFIPAVRSNPVAVRPSSGGAIPASNATGRALDSLVAGGPALIPQAGMSWCIINPTELPAGTPRSACQTASTSGPCTCQKYDPGNPPTPNGTYSGLVY